jgi:hypothetical protein
VAPFEVVGFSSLEELRERLGGGVLAGPGYRAEVWPEGVPWLPAGATAADVAAGRVRADAREDGAWVPSWAQIEHELAQLDKLMDIVASARAVGVAVREECWAYIRGVHRAAAWSLGVTDVMPLDAGRGPVNDAGMVRVVNRAVAWMNTEGAPWDAEGAAAWLAWLDGAREEGPRYPPGC